MLLATLLPLAALLATLSGCATPSAGSPGQDIGPRGSVRPPRRARGPPQFTNPPGLQVNAPMPDPRVGLAPGMFDAGEAIWNMRMLSTTPPQERFVGSTNSDLAFTGKYAIQGNYNGVQVWDISDPVNPVSVVTFYCPASQSDVSVYENLLFVSGEGFGGRLDCGTDPIQETVSHERLRGIRIFDISDIANPEYVANVQTCRGSQHAHRAGASRRHGERLHLRLRVGPGAAPRGTARLLGRAAGTKTPTQHCSGSR